jgi:hypothetical protein
MENAKPQISKLRYHLNQLPNLKGLDIDILRQEDGSVLLLGNGIKKKIKTTQGGKSFLTQLSNKIFYAKVDSIALKAF